MALVPERCMPNTSSAGLEAPFFEFRPLRSFGFMWAAPEFIECHCTFLTTAAPRLVRRPVGIGLTRH